jgi:hypothetical protein
MKTSTRFALAIALLLLASLPAAAQVEKVAARSNRPL